MTIIEMTTINPTEIKLSNSNKKEIRQLYHTLQDSNMQHWIFKIIKALLLVLPLKSIGKLLLNWVEERVQSTENNWDDAALYAFWVVLSSLDMADAPPDDLKERAKRLIPTL